MARENYYVLLKLDPDRDVAWAAIEPKLRAKRNEWSQQSITHPTRKNEFKQYLTSIPDIERVLQDDALRKQEADDARQLTAKSVAESHAELESKVQVTGAKGYLTPEDIKSLVAQGGGRWKEADVRAATAKLKKPIQASPSSSSAGSVAGRARLDAVIEGAIQKNLQFLNKVDLYAFLDAERTMSAKALRDLADKKYEEVRNLPKNPETTASQELIGQCLKLFASESERAKYDGTLQWLELDAIRSMAEMAGAGEGRIAVAVTQELILRGKRDKISPEDVVAAIKEVAARRKWVVEVPAVDRLPENYQRCGYDRELAPPTATHCPKCGRLLKVACPNCKTINPSDALVCAKPGCSFAIGDMPLGERAIRSAKACVHSNPDQAKLLLQEALAYYPNHPEVLRLREDIEKRAREVQPLLATVEKARESKAYHALKSAVEELARLAPGHAGIDEYRRECAAKLQATDALLEQARKLEKGGDFEATYAAYAKAWNSCSDSKEAREGLGRCPPNPPGMPAHLSQPTITTLAWKPSDSRGVVGYRVVRKSGSQPTRPNDGDEIANLTGLTLTDNSNEPGKPYYYAIFAERDGVFSKPAVVGPVVRKSEVEELQVRVGSGRVELLWKPPKNMKAVEVWRREGDIPQRGEGTRLIAVFGASATDTGLANGTQYGYRVVAIFDDAHGKSAASDGATCLATPVAPPEPVQSLNITRDGAGRFEATWSPPPTGEVRVYLVNNPQAVTFKPGHVIPVGELDRLGVRLPPSGPNGVRGTLESLTELHLLPVTLIGQAAVAGLLTSVNWVDPVKHLKTWCDGDTLRARWDFPNGFDLAVVAYRTDKHPEGPEDPAAQRFTWSRGQSQLDGCFHCPAPSAARVYVAVYSCVNRGESPQYSEPCQVAIPVRARQRCTYRIRRQRRYLVFPTGNWEILFSHSKPTYLPELVVTARADAYPLSPTDGHQIHRIDPTYLNPRRAARSTLSPPDWFDVRHCRVFPAREEDLSWLQLLPQSRKAEFMGHALPSILLAGLALACALCTAFTPAGWLAWIALFLVLCVKWLLFTKVTCPFCLERFHLAMADRRDVSPTAEKTPDFKLAAHFGLNKVPDAGPVHSPRWWRRFLPVREKKNERRICPHCHLFLPEKLASGEARGEIIAVVGARNAGKSNFFGVLINSLRRRYGEEVGFDIIDGETHGPNGRIATDDLYQERYGKHLFNSQMPRAVKQTDKVVLGTKVAAENDPRIPLIYMLRFRKRWWHYLTNPFTHRIPVYFMVYDAAGENMSDQAVLEQHYPFIQHATGLIFLVDPFDYPGIRARLPNDLRARLPSPMAEPARLVDNLIRLLHSHGGWWSSRRIRVPVAFTLTKSDLFARTPGMLHESSLIPQDAAHLGGFDRLGCQALARELEQRIRTWDSPELLGKAQENFARHQFFAISALGSMPTGKGLELEQPVSPTHIADPLLWLLWIRGYIPSSKC